MVLHNKEIKVKWIFNHNKNKILKIVLLRLTFWVRNKGKLIF